MKLVFIKAHRRGLLGIEGPDRGKYWENSGCAPPGAACGRCDQRFRCCNTYPGARRSTERNTVRLSDELLGYPLHDLNYRLPAIERRFGPSDIRSNIPSVSDGLQLTGGEQKIGTGNLYIDPGCFALNQAAGQFSFCIIEFHAGGHSFPMTLSGQAQGGSG